MAWQSSNIMIISARLLQANKRIIYNNNNINNIKLIHRTLCGSKPIVQRSLIHQRALLRRSMSQSSQELPAKLEASTVKTSKLPNILSPLRHFGNTLSKTAGAVQTLFYSVKYTIIVLVPSYVFVKSCAMMEWAGGPFPVVAESTTARIITRVSEYLFSTALSGVTLIIKSDAMMFVIESLGTATMNTLEALKEGTVSLTKKSIEMMKQTTTPPTKSQETLPKVEASTTPENELNVSDTTPAMSTPQPPAKKNDTPLTEIPSPPPMTETSSPTSLKEENTPPLSDKQNHPEELGEKAKSSSEPEPVTPEKTPS
eukprot:m.342353 g.342353  ORF g.342353 m.342353 type:complete len:313 (-) comp21301_c0_seq1:194-1132(-)